MDMEVTFRNDDTGEERTVHCMDLVPYHMKNGEIRQANGTFWRFEGGAIVAKKTLTD